MIPLKMKGVELNRFVAGILKKGGVEFVTGMEKMLVPTKDYSLCPDMKKKLHTLVPPLPLPPLPITKKFHHFQQEEVIELLEGFL